MRQRNIRDHLADMLLLGSLAPQEFPSRRGIEEQIAHDDLRSGRTAERRGGNHFSAVDDNFKSLCRIAAARAERHFRDGGNTRHRLTAETER